ncbi:transposase [Pseudogracilibacillus sp. SO30301A]|uniref:transposase n=1 Tax=Pseudogracilibacillus sp. SO30301A TaxID=3098291 RepID=UPI00300E51B3
MLSSTIVLERKSIYIDHDRLFKELIQTFFQEFIEAFFPKVHAYIDFSSVTFLEQEVFTDILIGEKRKIDILAEVQLNDEERLVLIHVEPQSSYQKEFHERMFIYCSRLYEKYRKPILPIAVFSYNKEKDVSDTFIIEFPTFSVLEFHYLQLHLIKKNWRAFIRKDNPAAAALLSKMGYTEKERVQVKLEFLRMVSRMELDPARTALLYGFFETYLKLNEEEEKQMREEISNLPEEEATRILELPNSYFEKGMERGMERGMEQVAVNMIKKGFSNEEIVDITGLSNEKVKEIRKKLDE